MNSPRHIFQSPRWLALSLLLIAVGCPKSSTPPTPSDGAASSKSRSTPISQIRFEDVTASSGVNFTYRNGEEEGEVAILESLGGGVGLFDLDGDGDLDLCLPGGGHYTDKNGNGKRDVLGWPHAIYRNDGNFHFTDVTELTGATASPYYSHGAAAADYDNDGFCDLLITGYGGVLLLRNQGDGTLEELAKPAGMTDSLWSSSAAWGDFNKDGALDIYIAHYVNWSFDNHPFCPGPKSGTRESCPPREFKGLPDVLYFNNGDGTFRDVSSESGLQLEGKGLGVMAADFDVDGDVDVYVGNDTVANFLFRNDGTGKFEEIGLISGSALSQTGAPDGSMGVDVGDFNLDGRPDLWVANYERESIALYRNDGNCLFRHVSQGTGVTAVGALYVGWGTAFCDFDNDGDVDILIWNMDAPPSLLRNDLKAPDRHWLKVKLEGTVSNRSAIGARVTVSYGGKKQAQEVMSQSSFYSVNDWRLHFGLGAASVADVEVRWPTGTKDLYPKVAAGALITIREGRGITNRQKF